MSSLYELSNEYQLAQIKLSESDYDAVKNREAKVADLIKTMGHKYILSRPIPRVK